MVLGLSQSGEVIAERFVDSTIPQPHYSPAEVVALQVDSIRASLAQPERLVVCYSLASPQNRAVTGPFERFAAMVMMSPYDQLATCAAWQIGNAAIEDGYAAVLVSTVSRDEQAVAFRFLLHQHWEAPFRGCWLTEAVHVLEQVDAPEILPAVREKESPVD